MPKSSRVSRAAERLRELERERTSLPQERERLQRRLAYIERREREVVKEIGEARAQKEAGERAATAESKAAQIERLRRKIKALERAR